MLAEAALVAFRRQSGGDDSRELRNALQFLVADKRAAPALVYTAKSSARWALDPNRVLESIRVANRTIELIHDLAISNEVPIFALLGLRNLSSFVGEIFAGEVYKLHKDRFRPNPNQDGYPDLLALTPEGVPYIAERERLRQMDDKKYWSPYPFGGIEVKATCGNTPSSSSLPKPKIGESRLPILQSAEWKAHHQKTNNLLGIYWDFVDGLPTVLAAFYRNDLTTAEWGAVVVPKQGGGRTTSVSIMKRTGVMKMGQGWIALPRHAELLLPLAQARVFALDRNSVARYCSNPEIPGLGASPARGRRPRS